MFNLKIGDQVFLNESGIRYAKGIVPEHDLKGKIFKITDITFTDSCEENNPNCTCDKFLKIELNGLEIKGIISEEVGIYDIIENQIVK